MTATFAAPAAGDAILDDLAVAPGGSATLAWHTIAPVNAPGSGFVASAPAGGVFGAAQQVPAGPGATDLRLAYDPQGILVAWNQRTPLNSAVLAAELG